MVSGAFAGLAGGALLTGEAAGDRFTTAFSGNFGWQGLLVALLARDRPLVAIPMALVFAALRTGSGFLAATGVERRIADVVQAMLVLALLIPPAIAAIRDRRRAVAAARAGRHGDRARDGRSRRVIWDVLSSSILYESAFRLAVLFVLAATGEWIAERAGTLNISLEGMILAGAFGAAVGSSTFDSVWVGLVYAAVAGLVLAAVQANMSHRLTANQFVVGLTLNVLVVGLTAFLDAELKPVVQRAGVVEIPLLSKIPLVGDRLLRPVLARVPGLPAVPLAW